MGDGEGPLRSGGSRRAWRGCRGGFAEVEAGALQRVDEGGSSGGDAVEAVARGIWVVGVVFVFAGNAWAQPVEQPATAPEYEAMEGWLTDSHAEALPALRHSCSYFGRVGTKRTIHYGDQARTTADWTAICAAAEALPPEDEAVRQFFERWFTPVAVPQAQDEPGRPQGDELTARPIPITVLSRVGSCSSSSSVWLTVSP